MFDQVSVSSMEYAPDVRLSETFPSNEDIFGSDENDTISEKQLLCHRIPAFERNSSLLLLYVQGNVVKPTMGVLIMETIM